MLQILAVAVGGAMGTLCRFGAHAACERFATPTPYGTLAVNVVGCFLLGMLAASPLGRHALSHGALAVGFLGGLTTFSTFGLETVRLLQGGQAAAAAANVSANVLFGLGAVVLGMQLGKAF